MNKLTITDNILSYEIDPENKWSLEIDKIKFIGEYTTSAGPLADDWFFVFADSIDDWWQVTALAVDHNTFWTDIGKKLGSEIAPNLFASTSWATSVIYPKSLEGQELFVVVETEEEKPRTFWQKIFGTRRANTKFELTDKVKQLF